MHTYSAQWIVPIVGPPIHNGFITVNHEDRIETIGGGSPAHATALGNVVILPVLVNAHTHLELSFLRGRVPPSDSFHDWVTSLMQSRRSMRDPESPEILDGARQAIVEARRTGTGLIGDISNTLVTVDLLRAATMPAHVFYEQIGFNIPDVSVKIAEARAVVTALARDAGDAIRVSLAPHAPYSVSPALFKAIRASLDETRGSVTSVHLGESPQEIQFLRDGTGPARTMLERLGVWTDEWTPPAASPVEYLARLGFIDASTAVVHGVQFDADDLARLKAIGATLVSCPRSNRHVGAGSPPLERFYESGVRVAFGTDSLASVADLNMFNELAEARRIAPSVSARRLLESATVNGARALGRDSEFGSFEIGKRFAITTVLLPARPVSDVEEYLVDGVEPEMINRLPL